MESKISNELKVLALEMINNDGSGHSGSVLSCGDALYTLYTRHLLTDGTKNNFRDRFVLSNGHVCAIHYAVLAGLGYIDIEELKTFRKYGTRLTGHPEIELAGVDASTGPLGQGVGNAVGMAIAETIMNKHFGVDNYTYCIAGDGCLQEGVGLESLSIAGLYKLNKFILLYDKNNVTLDGDLNISSVDDFKLKFRSMNFNVLECDGHDIDKIDKAIIKAKQSKDKPTVIILNTVIAKGTKLENSNKSHGAVFAKEEIDLLKQKLNIDNEYLSLNKETKEFLNNKKIEINNKFNEKILKITENLNKNKELLKKYNKFIKNDFKFKVKLDKTKMGIRDANNYVLNEINKSKENIVTMSADLSSSTKVKINNSEMYSANNRLGKNIAMGIREHSMGAIANGIALYGGLNVITSTFLTFSNYMIQPIRMAAIMNLPVMFTFSHTSHIDSADGTTHVPIEQLDQLRLIPNTIVARPCDMEEILECYNIWQKDNKPMCLCVAKSSGNFNVKNSEDVKYGAYYLTTEKTNINIIASGTDVDLAMQVKNILNEKRIKVNVVSMLSFDIFEKQTKQYKNKILNKELFAIEMGIALHYLKYVKEENIFNIKEFGVTADAENCKKHFNLTAEIVSNKIIRSLKK